MFSCASCRTENGLSSVAEVTGMVMYNWSNEKTSLNIFLITRDSLNQELTIVVPDSMNLRWLF